MTGQTDQALLREFVQTSSNDAFSQLVHRHVDLVYSTAIRVLRNATLAEDVTQRTFVALAQQARKLEGRLALVGWLYETARNFAIATVRSEERRRRREQEAAAMQSPDYNSDQNEDVAERFATHLDAAFAQLKEADRDTILLRYVEGKTAREIGETLGVAEEAAQKRATRALDKLRLILATRGVSLTATGLAGALSIHTAPTGLAASTIGAATAAIVLPATSTIGLAMASAKTTIGLAAIITAGLMTPLIIQTQKNTQLESELASLRHQTEALDRTRNDLRQLRSQTDATAAERNREQSELIRLRGELATLRASAPPTADSIPGKHSAPAIRNAAPLEKEPDNHFIRAENWANVGFDTPSATFQTLNWARTNRDTNVIASSLAWSDAASRASIEALFASAPESVRSNYGTADAFILSLFDHGTPDDSRRAVSFRILTENTTEDEAALTFEQQYADGQTRLGSTRFVKIDDQWRQALDFDQPEQRKLSTALQADSPPAPE